MTYEHARMLFDAMDMDQKDHVTRTFDLIRSETGFPRIYDAFVAAVDDECKTIAIETLLETLEPNSAHSPQQPRPSTG